MEMVLERIIMGILIRLRAMEQVQIHSICVSMIVFTI